MRRLHPHAKLTNPLIQARTTQPTRAGAASGLTWSGRRRTQVVTIAPVERDTWPGSAGDCRVVSGTLLLWRPAAPDSLALAIFVSTVALPIPAQPRRTGLRGVPRHWLTTRADHLLTRRVDQAGWPPFGRRPAGGRSARTMRSCPAISDPVRQRIGYRIRRRINAKTQVECRGGARLPRWRWPGRSQPGGILILVRRPLRICATMPKNNT